MSHQKPIKPLNKKCYGSIPHLPGSKRGPADKGLELSNARYLTVDTKKPTIKETRIVYVHEKLDGSCVGVAKLGNTLVPLIRSGYSAEGSIYNQHRVFHQWVLDNAERFSAILHPGERVCGEWLLEAHGTKYNLPHEPFVVFDIFDVSGARLLAAEVDYRCKMANFVRPRLLHSGNAISVPQIIKLLEPGGHGNIDPVEGAVWRLENTEEVLVLGKYVRHESIPGKYFTQTTGEPTYYNQHPGDQLKDVYRHLLP